MKQVSLHVHALSALTLYAELRLDLNTHVAIFFENFLQIAMFLISSKCFESNGLNSHLNHNILFYLLAATHNDNLPLQII